MQNVVFAAALLSFGAMVAPAAAQMFVPRVPTLPPPPMSTVTTTNVGSMSFSNGMVGGAPYSANTQYMGNMAITNGTYGGTPFSSTTMGLGPNMSTTTVTTP